MSNQQGPRTINETVVDKLYDDCYKVKQHLDLQRLVSYTVLYNPLTGKHVGLVYDKKEDQHYQITSEEQYRNGQHKNRESAFPFWLSFKQNREKSTKQ